jgi:hypothetical protein
MNVTLFRIILYSQFLKKYSKFDNTILHNNLMTVVIKSTLYSQDYYLRFGIVFIKFKEYFI